MNTYVAVGFTMMSLGLLTTMFALAHAPNSPRDWGLTFSGGLLLFGLGLILIILQRLIGV